MSGPQPTPEPAPTPTPDVSHVALPDVPSNTYQLLSNLADAIDTANTNFTTHATKLAGISQETNGAVNNVTSTSQGKAATTLSDIWTNTQTDFNRSHDPLQAIAGKDYMGGSPNPLRAALDDNKASIQNGLIAMENIQMLQRSCPLQPPSAAQVEQWIQEVNALTASLGNVNLALETMIIAIRNLNGGFSASCATGFVPGTPPPTFPNNAFASTSSGGTGGTSSSNPTFTKGQVEWVDENAHMSPDARSYNDSAPGVRTDPVTGKQETPALNYKDANGDVKQVRFDGQDGNVMVDRKLSVTTFPKSQAQALRQSEALSQNGLTGRWEVPTQAEADRATKMFAKLGITNITVKVVPYP